MRLSPKSALIVCLEGTLENFAWQKSSGITFVFLAEKNWSSVTDINWNFQEFKEFLED